MSTTKITDHLARARARLLEQYRNKAKVESLFRGTAEGVQELEDAFWTIITDTTLDGSFGIQLDRLGDIVGIERGVLADEPYRLRLRARILVNISNGDPETLIQVFQLLTQSELVTLLENFPGGVSLYGDGEIVDQDDVNLILELVEAAALGGVRVDFMGKFDATEPFAFAGSLPGLGFGSVSDAGAGGKFAGLYTIRQEFAFDGDDPKPMGFSSVFDPVVGGRFVGL